MHYVYDCIELLGEDVCPLPKSSWQELGIELQRLTAPVPLPPWVWQHWPDQLVTGRLRQICPQFIGVGPEKLFYPPKLLSGTRCIRVEENLPQECEQPAIISWLSN